ncbi:hypothetical protein CCX46_24425 [Pseudomonas sp. RU47]|uniref:hypothetical protein n=1 Tax=Pseudomonas sp. RU47 TaxID=2005388 RepID=UPI000FDD43E4|nr:hypothetical protein [Pseudomonas sp. RU47]AZZ78155.1 hypothetical protein CCX46_24425 [Pseudomonas sp. RU47]
MSILEQKDRFEVKEESLTRAELVRNASPSLAEIIKGKNLIILPSHETVDEFYAGSLDTLDYLNERNVDAEIYSTDEDYKELSLHGADFWLGTFFVSSIVLPLLTNLMSSYIYDKLKAQKDDGISLKLIIERKSGSTVSISFDGKIEKLEKVFTAIKELENEV